RWLDAAPRRRWRQSADVRDRLRPELRRCRCPDQGRVVAGRGEPAAAARMRGAGPRRGPRRQPASAVQRPAPPPPVGPPPRALLPRPAGVRALPGVRPPTWQRRAVHGSAWALLIPGAAWLVVHYLMGSGDLPHPAEAWALRLHGIAAYVFLMVFGSMG